MKVYKLKYNTKEIGIADLLDKGVLIKIEERIENGLNTLGVVYVGLIVDVQGEYNDRGEEITPPTYIDGCHIDVACKIDSYDFGENEGFPNNPKHNFA